MRYEREVLPISRMPEDVDLGDEVMVIDMGEKEPAWRLCLVTPDGFFEGSSQDFLDYQRQLQATGGGYAHYVEMPTHFTMPPPLPLPVATTRKSQ